LVLYGVEGAVTRAREESGASSYEQKRTVGERKKALNGQKKALTTREKTLTYTPLTGEGVD
jgi:hypothetical protein